MDPQMMVVGVGWLFVSYYYFQVLVEVELVGLVLVRLMVMQLSEISQEVDAIYFLKNV